MQQRLGRYELLERIASGGQGTVWRARDPNLDRIVAIKVLNQPVADDPRYLEALQREARLAAGLVHPNITAVFDFQVEGDIPYIVMEYVPDTLSNHLQDGQLLPYQRAIDIAVQICRALSHAHTREIIHRDIKLQNILLTEEGNVKVSDFGIARALASSTRSSANTTTMGTPYYMSPEQWNAGRVDGRSDIYALGILLYEMLTGSVPFKAESIGAIYVQHQNSPVPALAEELRIPNVVEAVVRMALEKDPDNRFNSAEAMANALQRSLNPDATPERPAPTPTPNVPIPPREPVATPPPPQAPPPPIAPGQGGRFNPRWLIFGGVVVVVLLIVTVAVFSLRYVDDSKDIDQAYTSVVTPLVTPTKLPKRVIVTATPEPTKLTKGAVVTATPEQPDTLSPSLVPVSMPLEDTLELLSGTRIVFESSNSIRSSKPDGSREIVLAEPAYGPVVSPNGKRLAFFSRGMFRKIGAAEKPDNVGTDENHLTLIDLSRLANHIRISDVTVPGHSPEISSQSNLSWSPDSSKLAFTAYDGTDSNPGIYLINADGSGLTRLTDIRSSNRRPSFSHNGNKIAFYSDRDGDPNKVWNPDHLYVMNSDGTNQVRINTNEWVTENPVWSPVDNTILYKDLSGPGGSIYSIDSDGSGMMRLATGEDYAWSPDGRRIVFATSKSGDSEIYIIDSDGSNETRLTENTGKDVNPFWAPNSSAVIFSSYRERDPDLYIVNLDGSEISRITNNIGSESNPIWYYVETPGSTVSPIVLPSPASELAQRYYDQATKFVAQKSYIAAILRYEQAINLDPNRVTFRYHLGVAWTHRENGDSPALMQFEKVIELDPSFAGAYHQIARIYDRQDQLGVAESYYSQACALDKIYCTP